MSKSSQFDHYSHRRWAGGACYPRAPDAGRGPDGVLFPATFAAGDGFPGGYNIDPPPTRDDHGRRQTSVSSTASVRKRIESSRCSCGKSTGTSFRRLSIKAGEHEVNILEAGHRAGDALLRCSSLQKELQDAFNGVLAGNAEALAKIAPTSLVFGVWDSRDTQAKLPRVVGSSIRAFNVRKLTRGAVYIPPLDYSELDVFSEEDKAKAEGNNKSPLAKRGFVHNPASEAHGGVIADGGIRRDATLGIGGIRQLHAGKDAEQTLILRRYILGLSLVAFTAHDRKLPPAGLHTGAQSRPASRVCRGVSRWPTSTLRHDPRLPRLNSPPMPPKRSASARAGRSRSRRNSPSATSRPTTKARAKRNAATRRQELPRLKRRASDDLLPLHQRSFPPAVLARPGRERRSGVAAIATPSLSGNSGRFGRPMERKATDRATLCRSAMAGSPTAA